MAEQDGRASQGSTEPGRVFTLGAEITAEQMG